MGWQIVAMLFCMAFGFAHLLNVFTIGDGIWFWYGMLVRQGKHVYSDLHLNLQPLFVLLTRYSLGLFGSSWISFRVLPAIQVVLYSVGLMLLARYIPWRDRNRAILILAAFSLTMTIDYYRFDDFHVTTQIFQIYALWLLLILDRDPAPHRALWVASVLGLLSGLSLANRLNDGAALLGACAIAIFGSAPRNRVMSTVVCCVVAAGTFLGAVLLTGDKLATWFLYSVVFAAKIKSGSGHIWLYPLVMPLRVVWRFLETPHALLPFVYFSALVLSVVAAQSHYRRTAGQRRNVILFGLAIVAVFAAVFFVKNALLGVINPTLADVAVPISYGLFVVTTVRFLRHLAGLPTASKWHARELLLLVPMFQLFLAAMTAGGGASENTPSMALTLLLLPIVSPIPLSASARRVIVLSAALIAIAGFPLKYFRPYWWHSYRSDIMFHDRAWIQHPSLGPMYIETTHYRFIKPVCDLIAQQPGTGVLSMPYPHVNYFCNRPPWHDYVQTWYDTSSKSTIEGLVQELTSAPPTWIFYERSLITMRAHEDVYNGHRALPHRQIDALLVQRIHDRQWTIVHRECLADADWILIRTSSPRPNEPVLSPAGMDGTTKDCYQGP